MRTIMNISLAAFVMAACGSSEAPPEESQSAPETETTSEPQIFEGVGTIESIGENQENVTIAHEEIVGFMGAMTMTFNVDEGVLDDIASGTRVKFWLVVNPDGSYFIDKIEVIGSS